MSKKNKHSAEWYLHQAWKIMEEIATLPGSEGVRFLMLKKKARKYVEKAKEINPDATIHIQKVPKGLPIQSPPSGGKGVSVPLPAPSDEEDGVLNKKSHGNS